MEARMRPWTRADSSSGVNGAPGTVESSVGARARALPSFDSFSTDGKGGVASRLTLDPPTPSPLPSTPSTPRNRASARARAAAGPWMGGGRARASRISRWSQRTTRSETPQAAASREASAPGRDPSGRIAARTISRRVAALGRWTTTRSATSATGWAAG